MMIMTKHVQPNGYIFTVVANHSILWGTDHGKHMQNQCRRSYFSAINLIQVVICSNGGPGCCKSATAKTNYETCQTIPRTPPIKRPVMCPHPAVLWLWCYSKDSGDGGPDLFQQRGNETSPKTIKHNFYVLFTI